MELTAEKLNKIHTMARDLHSRNYSQDEIRNEQNTNKLLKLILANPPCKGPTDKRLVKKLKYENIENHNLLNAINCLLTETSTIKDPFLVAHLNYGFPQKLADQGITGAVTLSFRGKYIVKSSKDSEELLQEYSTGYFATNNYRDVIPNFAGVLGLFRCSPPVFYGKETNMYCDHDSPYYYLVYEPIEGPTLYDFLPTCTMDQLYQVMTGIYFALEYAYQKNKFTHYDLHFKNIIIRTYPQPISIDYGSGMILTTKYVPVIIDYGFSVFEYNGVSYGTIRRDIEKINGPNPNHDIFKITMFTLLRLTETNKDVYNKVKTVAKYFNSKMGFVGDYLTEIRDTYYAYPLDVPQYPLTKRERQVLTGRTFWEAFKQYLSQDVSKFHVMSSNKYGCNPCLSLDQAVDLISTSFDELPKDYRYLLDLQASMGDNLELKEDTRKNLEVYYKSMRKTFGFSRIQEADNYSYMTVIFRILRIMGNVSKALELLTRWFPDDQTPLALEIAYQVINTQPYIKEFNDSFPITVAKVKKDLRDPNIKSEDKMSMNNFLETVHKL